MFSRSSRSTLSRPRWALADVSFPLALSIALVSLTLSLSSCDTSPLSSEERRSLEAAEAKWASRAFETYSFEMRRSCFCAPVMLEWARIEVVEGEVQRVVLVESGTEVPVAEREFFPTVDGVFAIIHSTLNGDWMESIDLEFDAEFGFPTTVHFMAKEGIADADASYFLRNVAPIGSLFSP